MQNNGILLTVMLGVLTVSLLGFLPTAQAQVIQNGQKNQELHDIDLKLYALTKI